MRHPRPTSAASRSEGEECDLDALREAIDSVDREILAQLNERARLAERVGARKRELGEGVYRAARERDLVAQLVAENPGPFPSEAIAAVFREIISGSRALEERPRVAFLGPEGTFSHLAVREKFGALVDPHPVSSLSGVFDAVARRKAALGIVPLENTTEGVVTETLDRLAESELPLCGELLLPVSQHLMSRSGSLADVRQVASIPQALAQCRSWLDRHLPRVERLEVASTAVAARLAASEEGVAAVGSSIAAEVNGLRIVERSIEDRSDNTTRFLVIGGHEPPPSAADSTLVVCTVAKTRAGALHTLLEPFSRHEVNLASIHSRPIPGKPWEYLFILELEGHRQQESVIRAMAEAEAIALSCRCLGSFPRTPGGAP
ncbi:MAG: prephenate dehydratase [Myxococcota bacterium]